MPGTLAVFSTSIHSSSACARSPVPPELRRMAGMPRLIGRLASVLLNVNSGVRPAATAACAAICTIGASGGVRPDGRAPIELDVGADRAFRWSTARDSPRPPPRARSRETSSRASRVRRGDSDRMSTSIHSLLRNGIDRRAAAHHAHIERRLWRLRHADRATASASRRPSQTPDSPVRTRRSCGRRVP